MSDARAAIHAMFQLDEAGTAELDRRLDAYRVENFIEAAAFVGNDDTCGCGGCDTCYGRHLATGLLAMAGEKVTAPAATATPDFFQAGHAYTHRDGTDFKCVAVTTHPQTGERLAMGWHVDSWSLHCPATVGINQWRHEYDGVDGGEHRG